MLRESSPICLYPAIGETVDERIPISRSPAADLAMALRCEESRTLRWYVNQSSATVITPLVTNASHANPEDLPTTVSIHGTQRHERDVWENRRQMRFPDIRKRIPAGYSCLLLFELSLTPPFSVAKSTAAL